VVSGYNTSNAIGELCYHGCRVDQTAADWAVRSNARTPCRPGLNETWQLVGEKTDNALSTESGDEYRFAPCEARYVRVTILHNSANNAGHIVELGVYR
jgi:hypothetical protein